MRITASSSWMRISTRLERPTVSIQNGLVICRPSCTESVWSSSEKNGFGPGGGGSAAGGMYRERSCNLPAKLHRKRLVEQREERFWARRGHVADGEEIHHQLQPL